MYVSCSVLSCEDKQPNISFSSLNSLPRWRELDSFYLHFRAFFILNSCSLTLHIKAKEKLFSKCSLQNH